MKTTLPEKWYCRVTEENQTILNDWRRTVATYCLDYFVPVGYIILSKHRFDDSYYYTSDVLSSSYEGYEEITTQEFKKLVLNSNHIPDKRLFLL